MQNDLLDFPDPVSTPSPGGKPFPVLSNLNEREPVQRHRYSVQSSGERDGLGFGLPSARTRSYTLDADMQRPSPAGPMEATVSKNSSMS